MRGLARAGIAVAGLGLAFGVAVLAGAAVPQIHDDAEVAEAVHGHAAEVAPAHGGGHATAAPAGLAVAEDGYRLVPGATTLPAGEAVTWRFRVVGPDGDAVTDFDVEHEKRLHLIVVRRDATGFQHLHPEMASDGTWSTDLKLDEPGSYRLFADFSHKGEKATLATDLRVDGPADLRPLPAPEATAVSDGGYDVRLDAGAARPGREADLRFTITRGGEAVRTEPYLGAGGHLVALRDGDMAFLHVHPTADDSVRFAATFPTEGRYRLFLQFRHEGRVQTVAFTHEVS